MKLFARLAAALFAPFLIASAVAAPARPSLVVVLVIDGLRPDSIQADVAPNLARLKSEGASYNHSHSVFPTVTRVNSTSISTGALPSKHGIVGNSLYVPKIMPRLLNTSDYLNLLKLGEANGGRITPLPTLGEELERNGIRYVAMGSGSTGASLLLNHLAPSGKGSLINPGFENGKRVAFPDALNTELLRRFPPQGKLTEDTALVWTERTMREYVLTEMHPQVIVDWMTPTDGAQHAHGVGSPEGLAALRLVDQQIGLLQEKLAQLGLKETTDIIITCDHGFDYEPGHDLLTPIQTAGLTDDVVVDNEGGSSLLYVKDHDPEKIRRLAEGFQQSDATNVILVAARRPERGTFQCDAGATKGWLPGTFALDFVYQCLPDHGPDLIVTYHWEKTPNPFGVPGTQWVPGKPATAGQPVHSGHGGLNPWVLHSTLLLHGPDFQQAAALDAPAGNQDIAPTILSIQGLPIPNSMQGRVLAEALQKPEKTAAPAATTRRIEVSRGIYCAVIEVSTIGDRRYLNYGSRCSDTPPGK